VSLSCPHDFLFAPALLLHINEIKITVFWVVAIIALMTEAARTSETLVNFYQTTRRYNPEDSHLRIHRRENLKSYLIDEIVQTGKPKTQTYKSVIKLFDRSMPIILFITRGKR
jgi:hypothetical protein